MYYFIEEFASEVQGDYSCQSLLSAKGKVYRKPSGCKTLQPIIGSKSCFAGLHSGVGWGEIPKNPIQLLMPVNGAGTEWGPIYSFEEFGLHFSARNAGAAKRDYYRFMKNYRARNLGQCLREDRPYCEQTARRTSPMSERDAIKRAHRAGERAA